MAEEIVVTDISANARQFLAAMDSSERAARMLERQLLNLVATVNSFDKAINTLKAAGLKFDVKVDTSSLDRAETDIKALDGSSVNVDVTADTARAEARIKSLEDATNKVDIPVSADTSQAEAAIRAVDDNAPSPVIPVDADVSKAESAIKSLDGGEVTTKVDGDTSAIEAKLDAIRNIATIDLILNIRENLENAPIVGGVVGRDTAASTLSARTGIDRTAAGDAIDEVYAGAYGESAGEIANNIALVEQLDIKTGTLASNTTIAWDTAAIAGEDFANTLEVMDKLVKTGLAPNFQAASDIIVGGIQKGANRSNDFLDTLREYSSVFEQGGYSGESAVNLMVQALEMGTFNTDKLGDTVKENILKINEAIGDVGGVGGTARPILEKFDLLDDAELIGQSEELGGITAETFAARFLETLTAEFQAGNIDLAEFNFSLAEVFGTPVEDLGFDIFKALDFGAAAASEGSFEGLGAEAAQQINDNLGTAFTGLGRTIELEIVDTLAAAGFDLNAILDVAKEKVTEIGSLIRSGVAIPEALEIALEMPGLANTLHQIESVFGNVYLAFLDFIAKVQDFTGDTEGAAGTRQAIAEGGARQLAFDIKLAGDADDALRLLEVAEGRGVDPAAIGEAISGAATELVTAGDLEKAQALLDIVDQIPDAVARFHTTSGETIDLPIDIDPESTQAQIDTAIQTAIDAYQASGGSAAQFEWSEILFPADNIDTSAAQSLIDTTVGDLRNDFDTAMDDQNWVEAFNIADKLNDEGGMAMAQEQMRKTGADLIGVFAEGFNSINPFAEQGQTPVGFISEDVQRQTDGTLPAWKEEINRSSDALLDMGLTAADVAGGVGILGKEVDDTDLIVSIFGETVLATLSGARDNMATYSPEVIAWLEKIRDASTAAGGALSKVVVPGGTPGTSTGGGSTGGGATGNGGGGGGSGGEDGISTSATGGTFDGWGWVGEEGAEMIFADESMAVLNNNTSMAVAAGMSMMGDWFGSSGGAGGTTYNDNRVISVNTNNSNYGAAQRGSSDARTANALRGF